MEASQKTVSLMSISNTNLEMTLMIQCYKKDVS
jgi:hypothetical protein